MNPMILLSSFTILAGATQPVPPLHTGVDSILTVDVLTKMATFWTGLSDSMKFVASDDNNGTRPELKRGEYKDYMIRMPVGLKSKKSGRTTDGWSYVANVVYDSAKWPEIAEALKKANLSAEDFQFYRMLICQAYQAKIESTFPEYSMNPGDVVLTPVQQKNIDLLLANKSVFGKQLIAEMIPRMKNKIKGLERL